MSLVVQIGGKGRSSVMLEAAVRDRLASVCVCYSVILKMTSSPIETERKARDADYQPNRCFLDAKDISKQTRDGVRDLGWSTKSAAVAMNTLRRTTRVTTRAFSPQPSR